MALANVGACKTSAEAQGHGELIIDNVNLMPAENSTPLFSLAPGTITELAANTLSDSNANFPIPNPGTRAPGLIGLELKPDASRAETFTIVGNTEHESALTSVFQHRGLHLNMRIAILDRILEQTAKQVL